MSVVAFRPYKVRKTVNSEFVKITSTVNKEFAYSDLKKSGLTLEDMSGYATDNMMLPEGALAGYLIPYWDMKGDIISDREQNVSMYRVRLKYPDFHKAGKYTQPSGEELLSLGLPSFLPYLYPCEELAAETIYCCEGEKKTAAVVKHLGLPAFGISGCTMWGNPNRTGGPHPWILDYLKSRGSKRVVIIPDGDVFKYDICTAYGTFAHALIQAGYEVELLNPPDKIDDLIVQWGEGAVEELAAVPRLKPDELVQTPNQLAITYDLAFKRTKDDKVIVHQHTSNIMRLIEGHPAFPKLWRNLDTNRVNIGEQQATPDLTEMEIANHIQHNFGLERVTNRIVYQCIQAIAKKNQRSPMLDWIKGIVWDGVKRLDTWLTDTWGIGDTPFVREVGAKWLMSSCARMARPGAKVDWMFIVIGPQGTGKTSMPGLLFKGNSLTLYGDNSDKDLHMLLHSALVVGFDELDSFSRRDSSMLKAMITRTEDMFRPPYGASVEVFPRRFTLYGCGNRHEFLQHDPSGQRRYAIVRCEQLLDFKKLEEIRPQLWAEAWHRYEVGGTRWWEVEGASENAKEFEVPNMLQERMLVAIAGQKVKYAGNSTKEEFKFTMSDLFRWMDIPLKTGDPQVRDASAILRGMGYVNKSVWGNGATQRLWFPPG
jgi:hypothetical protein